MRLRHLCAALFCAAVITSLTGCATRAPEQLIDRRVKVSDATNKDLFLIVSQPLDDNDDPRDPSQGVKFPIGKYYLEAEDASFWYFRSTKPLTLAVYDLDGRQTNGMKIYGGIALSKTGDNTEPGACAYVDDQNKTGKIHVWVLSREFVKLRGTKWHLSTDAAR
ncbi:MAG TPA: hypothetical protein PKI32_05180 [Opitutales bacterium]|nr:hypothetical protein [Opitutales bacterium]